MSSQLALFQSPPVAPVILFTPADERIEIEATVRFALEEKAASTRRAYAADWRHFQAFCDARGLEALPALPATLARFVSSLATAGLKASTIGRRAAAVAYYHRLANLESPGNVEAVKATIRGIRRTIGAAPVKKAPATADLVQRMLDQCPNTLTGLRDRALISLGFAGALRRSELVALEVSDLVEAADGYRLTIKRSKTDQEGEGCTIGIPHGYKVRPVEHVRAWLAAAGITQGIVFRPIGKGGRVQSVALSGHSAAQIVKAYAKAAGLDPAVFAAHSLRSGFLTSSAESGASIFRMMDQSRHKSMDTLRGYVRTAGLFKDHAGAAFL